MVRTLICKNPLLGLANVKWEGAISYTCDHQTQTHGLNLTALIVPQNYSCPYCPSPIPKLAPVDVITNKVNSGAEAEKHQYLGRRKNADKLSDKMG